MTRLTALALILSTPAFADDVRQLDAHVHGIGEFNMAIDGTDVAMELHAPGFDIVGFEHAAKSDADRAAIQTALQVLAAPLDLFVPPAAASCVVTGTSVSLEAEEDHDSHDHGEHAHDDHDHGDKDHAHDDNDHGSEDHAHDDHDHGSEDHAHDDHDHGHDEHTHDDHDHADHAEADSTHSEFHAEYTLSCATPDALTGLTFAYFDTFAGAEALEVQVVTEAGAQGFDVTRDAPQLSLAGQ